MLNSFTHALRPVLHRQLRSEMMRKQRNQQNERDGHSQKIEEDRAHFSPPFLNRSDVIALPATDRGGEARAKSSHEQREEKPEQKTCSRFAGCIFCPTGLTDHIRNPSLRIRLAE